MSANLKAGAVVVGAVVAVGGLTYQTIGDWLSHHPRDYPKTLAKIEVEMKKKAYNT